MYNYDILFQKNTYKSKLSTRNYFSIFFWANIFGFNQIDKTLYFLKKIDKYEIKKTL